MVLSTEVFFAWKSYGEATLYLGNKTGLGNEAIHVIKYNTSLIYVGGRHLQPESRTELGS